MRRELGDERGRYGRKSLRERIEDVVDWPSSHPVAAGALLSFVVIGLLLAAGRRGNADLGNLAVGDCLYVPTDAANDPRSGSRPIGSVEAAEGVVVAGGAQRADCAASHGHEVAAIVAGPQPSIVPGEMPMLLDRDGIHRRTQPLCDAAFAGYVGRDLAGSAYLIFPVAPEPEAWLA